MSNAGLNFGDLFKAGTNAINVKGGDLQDMMGKLQGKENLGPEDLLPVQFQFGQYSAMMEATASVTKGITDMLKSVAQRTA